MRPVVALVGTEYEENLSLRYLAAAVEQAGFRAELVPIGDDALAAALPAPIRRLIRSFDA